MKIIIKPAIPESGSLWNLFLSTGWNSEYMITEKEYYETVNNSNYIVSAYYDGELIGLGRVVRDGILHAVIYDLIVRPEVQGKGVGSVILERLIEYCTNNNIRDIQLFSAAGKKEFYEKRGFVCRASDAPGMEYKKG